MEAKEILPAFFAVFSLCFSPLVSKGFSRLLPAVFE
jgi:hypothetical protein